MTWFNHLMSLEWRLYHPIIKKHDHILQRQRDDVVSLPYELRVAIELSFPVVNIFNIYIYKNSHLFISKKTKNLAAKMEAIHSKLKD